MRKEYKFKIDVPTNVKLLYKIFENNKKELYIVGGAVRDAFLNKEAKDYDLVTNALPTEVEIILLNENIYTFPSGKQFGIISAVINNETFEIATMRSDKYSDKSDGRHPESVEYGDIISDAARRDSSLGGLYYDIGKEIVIDLVGGVEDIKNKRLRAIGNVFDRCNEDKLRILRYIRFSHYLGFELDNETIQAIKNFKDLPGVSNERIRDEFLKGIKSAINIQEFLEQYTQLGLMERTFPGLTADRYFISGTKNPYIIIAKIVSNNNYDKISKSLHEAKYTGEEIATILFLIKVRDKLQQLDKLSFDTLIDGKWLISLTGSKNLVDRYGLISKEDIEKWASTFNIKKRVIDGFLSFKPQISASSFLEVKPGIELGNKITQANAELFLKSI